MPLDPSKAREPLAYSAFRTAGVPAPRTAFAEVTLTVPGKYDKEYLGLFTVVEDVDAKFLADRFGSDKFHFIPGDLEFSLGNFLLMGSPDQLMDLSVMKPYPGENKLPDRLLAIKHVSERYQKLLKELAATAFTKDRLLKEAEAIDQATKDIREKEAKAIAARKEPPAGFGGPGGMGPQPPDIRTFAAKRTESVAAQLAGKSKGYAPQQRPDSGCCAVASRQHSHRADSRSPAKLPESNASELVDFQFASLAVHEAWT